MTDSSYQKFIPNEYREFFTVVDDASSCMDTLLAEFNERDTKLFDLSACLRIFLFILTRSIKTYSSIIALCRLGYGQDVATLLRGLLENLITAKYILCDPKHANQLARRFVAYKWVIFKRSLPEQEKQIKEASPEKQREFYERKKIVTRHVEEFKKEYNITSDRGLLTWSGKTVRDMAKHISPELLAEYDLTFRQCSKFSHPTILGDQEYIVQDDKNLVFSPLPSPIGVNINLKQAVNYFLDFADLVDEHFQLNSKAAIDALRLRHHELFQNTEKPVPSSKSGKDGIPIRDCTVIFKVHDN